MSEVIHLLTGNQDKLRVARDVFDQYDITVASYDFDLPEIQADTSLEIARFAVQAAHTESGLAVLREDHSFFIDELGMPGPYMAYIDKRISVDNLLKIVDALPSRAAHFELAACFISTNGKMFESLYSVPLEIAERAAGNSKLRWERVMRFPGDTQTFAELESNRDDVWSKNYHSIAQQMISSE